MWQKPTILTIIICAFLYSINYILFSFKNVPLIFITRSYSDDTINIGFSLFEFEQAKLNEIELEQKYTLTAILWHQKKLSKVTKLVKYLFDSHLFKEIIIWNNNLHINLSLHQITSDAHVIKSIRIINSKENWTYTMKYYACLHANTTGCYFIDDSWDRPYYIKSLIAIFRSNPHDLHLITNSYISYASILLRNYTQQYVEFLQNDGNILYPFCMNNIHSVRIQKNYSLNCIRSPSFDDKFIFFTNMQQLSSYQTWNAVDNNLSTCWQTNPLIQSSDFFAIDFLRPQTNIKFLLTILHIHQFHENLELSISFDGNWWIPYRSLNGKSRLLKHTYLFDTVQFNQGFKSFRYMKFQIINNSSHQFLHICDIQIVNFD
ncbi:hypothetical protein I4U23_026194 [Adineta vaga]|nr:hypothetical protein I4U23_026194 [Adineta vaga]